MVVPIYAYLIEHSQEGLILVDTGINWRQTHEHGAYYTEIAHYLFDADEYELDRSEELPAALARLGHRPEDVHRVVITHLHEDHMGGLTYLPGSEVLISRDEWDNGGGSCVASSRWSTKGRSRHRVLLPPSTSPPEPAKTLLRV